MVYEHDPKDTRQVALSPPWCWLAVVGGLAIGAVGMIGATIATSPYGHRPVAAFFLSAHTDVVEPAKSMPPAPDEQRAALNSTEPTVVGLAEAEKSELQMVMPAVTS